jgi:hypothetical protein
MPFNLDDKNPLDLSNPFDASLHRLFPRRTRDTLRMLALEHTRERRRIQARRWFHDPTSLPSARNNNVPFRYLSPSHRRLFRRARRHGLPLPDRVYLPTERPIPPTYPIYFNDEPINWGEDRADTDIIYYQLFEYPSLYGFDNDDDGIDRDGQSQDGDDEMDNNDSDIESLTGPKPEDTEIKIEDETPDQLLFDAIEDVPPDTLPERFKVTPPYEYRLETTPPEATPEALDLPVLTLGDHAWLARGRQGSGVSALLERLNEVSGTRENTPEPDGT